MKSLIIALLLTVLTACGTFDAFQDGYDFGDVTRTGVKIAKQIQKAKSIYCSDKLVKQRGRIIERVRANDAAIAIFDKYGVDYKADGFCAVEIEIPLG